ncbi:MAG: NRDE family protein [Enterobacterales bacterium]|nr:NRDE family protein [Enterobacterales bacterium]
MCSLSWFKDNDKLVIYFSRDEMNSRSRARLPEIVSYSNAQVIMPIDPDAGGSWLSVNQRGVFIGLLNAYPKIAKNQACSQLSHLTKSTSGPTSILKVSRGKIVKDLAATSNLQEVHNYFLDQDLNQFKPFTFIFINHLQQWQFCWDSQQLEILALPQFISSSSWSNGAVVSYRQQQFNQLKSIGRDELLAFHQCHHATDQAFSLCMHRDDAKTVSLSEIRLTDLNVSYRYWDGSPCGVKPSKPIHLSRRKPAAVSSFIPDTKSNQQKTKNRRAELIV